MSSSLSLRFRHAPPARPGSARELAPGERELLLDALREIRRIEQNLRTVRDSATLRRFGSAEDGYAIAASLGYELLTPSEARVVDQLRTLPGSLTLVRGYLRLVNVPHVSVARAAPHRAPEETSPWPPGAEPRSVVSPHGLYG